MFLVQVVRDSIERRVEDKQRQNPCFKLDKVYEAMRLADTEIEKFRINKQIPNSSSLATSLGQLQMMDQLGRNNPKRAILPTETTNTIRVLLA